MASAGRKAKSGERYPSGKLKPLPREMGTAPAQIKRMIDMAKHNAADPTLATSAGWLRLHGKITTRQLAAAASYATLRGRFHRVMGFRPRTAASPSYGQGYAMTDGPEDEQRVLRIRSEHASLLGLFSPAELQFMDRICIDDAMPGEDELGRFVEHLARIAECFRMAA